MAAETEASVVMYGADWCRDCRRSKALLDRLEVAYLYRDVEHEEWAAGEAESISGRKSIPVIVLPGGKCLVEPSDADLEAALVETGVR